MTLVYALSVTIQQYYLRVDRHANGAVVRSQNGKNLGLARSRLQE
jgi:hypothetical protein